VAFGFLAGTPLVLFALLSHKFIIFLTLLIFAAIFLNFCTGPLNAITQDIIAPRMRATAVGITLLVGHMLGDAFSPFFIGVLDTKLHSLQQALLISIPTTFLLAGILCILGFRSVARDMQRMHIEEIA
jgi:MFS family permease